VKDPPLTATCACGNVEIEAIGRPIAATICYCDDCQAAGEQIEAMPGAPPFRAGDGGTGVVVFRKDRVRWIRGESLLRKIKLRAGSPTNRQLATCCNSAMVLDFDDSKHWVDIYSARVKGTVPRPEFLVCTKFAANSVANSDRVPAYPGYAPRFLIRLLRARIAMLFSS
jgi:hypothetical protein